MNVVVCGKVIPASTVTIEIDPNTKRMVRRGVPHELDPAAASAVEEGLRLTVGEHRPFGGLGRRRQERQD